MKSTGGCALRASAGYFAGNEKRRPDVPISSDVVSKVCKTGLTAASLV